MRRPVRLARSARPTLLALAALCAACATGGAPSTGGGTGSGSAPSPSTGAPTATPTSRAAAWPVKTREHVDLWLHGFALLRGNDSSGVPLFRRGYVDDLTVLKNRANVLTQLDANADRLRERMRDSRTLLNAQFLPFSFNSVDEMRATITRFVEVSGNPQYARSREEAAAFALIAGYFPSAADRSWLSLFSSSLWDESAKFYHSYWVQQQRERANVIDSVQAMWQHGVRPRIQGFLNNTQQRNGDVLLSLPLGGEGRTIPGSASHNVTAVTFPEKPSDAPEATYVILHELVGAVASTAVNDNITPAQQRSGEGERLSTIAAVRGGLMLAERTLPELADGYARYYLRQAGRTPGANPRAQLVSAFPLPDAVRDAVARQLDTVQGGI